MYRHNGGENVTGAALKSDRKTSEPGLTPVQCYSVPVTAMEVVNISDLSITDELTAPPLLR